ncbi:hypothetical protein SAMN06297422_1079 [Lachnospiraceae bacterium]|nr:hypothetical protein SAMN06297422_1079 [Lachnospiraceae bacterium]
MNKEVMVALIEAYSDLYRLDRIIMQIDGMVGIDEDIFPSLGNLPSLIKANSKYSSSVEIDGILHILQNDSLSSEEI